MPLPIGETTPGDYQRPASVTTVVVGKMRISRDAEGKARIGLNGFTYIGRKIGNLGIDQRARDHGLPSVWFCKKGRFTQ